MSNTLSVCMIIKNEAHTLRRCLESVKDIAHEIVVVDTGSTDSSCEIAAHYTDKLFHDKWRQDFALARNNSLSHATGEWVLYIDADETVPADSQRETTAILSKPTHYRAYWVEVVNQQPDGPSSSFFFPRLFKRKGAFFSGRVHEQLNIAAAEIATPSRPIQIHHSGYALPPDNLQKKFHRTKALLEKQIQETPDDPFPHFNLAKSYAQVEDYHSAYHAGKKALALSDGRLVAPYIANTYHFTAFACMALRRDTEALNLLSEGIARYPDYQDLYYDIGYLYAEQGSVSLATQATTRFFALASQTGFTPYERFTTGATWRVYQYLGMMHYKAQAFDRAESALETALTLLRQTADVQSGDLMIRLAVTKIKAGKLSEGIAIFKETVQRHPEKADDVRGYLQKLKDPLKN